MNDKTQHRPTPDTAEDAVFWVARLHSDQATSADEAAFAAWVDAGPERRAAYESALAVWDQLGVMSADPMARAAFSAVRPPSSQSGSRRAFMGLGLAAAACAGAAVLIGPGSESYATGVGEQRRASLSDGSFISLNTDTRVRVRFDGAERRVWLDRGQAHFVVAHDAQRPFRVFVGDEEVRALGTAFEVRREDGRMRVVLEEGVVALYRGGSETVLGDAPHNPDLVLAPGQAAEIAPERPAHVEQVDLRRAGAWRRGQMIFDADPLWAAVAEINRYHRRQIVLVDPSLRDIAISGVFQTGRPEAFADVLTSAFPIVIVRDTEEQISLAAAPNGPSVAASSQN
jgi:transmembrane sensor